MEGDFDAGFLNIPCGTQRLECWRGGIKSIIYNYESVPAGTLYINGVNERIVSMGLGNNTAAQAEMCQCLLTSNFTVPFPERCVL